MTTPRVTVPVDLAERIKSFLLQAREDRKNSGKTKQALEINTMLHGLVTAPVAPAPEGGAVNVPGGYLVKDFADGWYWTPNADLDHASGAPVWSVADGRYETDPPALTPRHEAPAEGAGDDGGLFLLVKRDLYYRPDAQGYTGIKDNAGRYTKSEAEDHADEASGVTAILATEAPEFSPACFDDLARAHLAKKLAQVTRELSALRAQPPARAWGWDYQICTGCSASLKLSCCPDRRMVTVRDLVDAYDAQRKPPAREDAQPVGWLRAVDEEMVCAHLGVADAEDSFETAKKKLASLIQWNIAVATDPSVGGHPAPDALRVAVEAFDVITDLSVNLRQGGPDSSDLNDLSDALNTAVDVAHEALAALQAEQKGGVR